MRSTNAARGVVTAGCVMELKDLIRRAEQLADMEKAPPLGKATLYRCEAHYPIPCFMELNCKNNVYLIYFGLYYDIFRFRFHEGKVLFKGYLAETRQYIESRLQTDLKALREVHPAAFLARATPMPFGDMGLCDNAFIESIRKFDGAVDLGIIGKIDALGASNKPGAENVLRPFLKHDHASLRMHALTAILTLKCPENEKLRAIIKTIEDSEVQIRELSSYCAKLMFEMESYHDEPLKKSM